jgi:ferredoxin-NADP reductase
MPPISRGFRGVATTKPRRHGSPPASTWTQDFPVLSAGPQADLIYQRELSAFNTTITLTREHWAARTGRVDRKMLAEVAWPATDRPLVYVCGPTGFVEAVADALVALGHDASRVRTERFGPT